MAAMTRSDKLFGIWTQKHTNSTDMEFQTWNHIFLRQDAPSGKKNTCITHRTIFAVDASFHIYTTWDDFLALNKIGKSHYI